MSTKILQIVDSVSAGSQYNILDNSNFANLITYRADYPGTESSDGLTFQFDRWRTSSSYVIGDSGLMLPAGTHYLQQGHPISTLGEKKYTAVITSSNGFRYGGIIDLTSATSGSVTSGAFTITLTKNYNSTFDRVYIKATISAQTTITSIALYEGGFAGLPEYTPKSEAVERINCLRYFRRIDSNSMAGVTYSGALQITVPIDIPLRITTPTLLIDDAGSIRAGGEKVIVTVNGSEVNASEPSLLSVYDSAIVLKIRSSYTSNDALYEAQLTTNSTGAWAAGHVGLDADFA